MSYKNIYNKLINWLVAIARARIGFYRRGLYRISSSGGVHRWLPSTDADATKWLVVAGREHYFESVKDYPIGHLNDVRKVLKNEPWRFPFRGLRFNKIQRVGEQVHRVTSWVIKPDLIDSLANRPLWVIPESVLLASYADETPVFLNCLGETVFVAETADGIVPRLGQEAAFLHRIGMSASVAADGLTQLKGTQGVDAQLRGLAGALVTAPLRFWAGFDAHRLRGHSWRPAAVLCAVIFALYMGLTSAYLVSANYWLDYRLRADTSAAEISILARRDIAMYHSRVETMRSVISPWPPIWAAWDVLLDMKINGINFRAVNISGESATYYITAKRATDVLDWLSRDPRIASAEFALPVRKARNGEQCAIEVTFKSPQSVDVAGTQIELPQTIAIQPTIDRSESAGNG